MTDRPDDIPEDVWEAADRVGETMHGRHERGWVMWPLIPAHGRAGHQEIVARAILAERTAQKERDAKIAEAWETVIPMWDRPGGPPGNGPARAGTPAEIAAAIRGSTP